MNTQHKTTSDGDCDGTLDHEERADKERASHDRDCAAVQTDGVRPCSCGYADELAAAIERSARTELQLQRSWVVAKVQGESVTWGDLHDAFERVKPAANWKHPIDAEFTTSTDPFESAREVELVREAVRFFCGCSAKVEHLGNFRFRCEAVGYYAAVGA